MAGTVSVRKRGNKYQYYFEGAKVDGKRQRVVKSGFATKKEAQEAGIAALAEYNNSGVAIVDSEISAYDFAQTYIEYCSKTLKWATYESYKGVLNAHFLKELGHYKLSKINYTAAENLIINMKEIGLSHSTIRKNLNVIRNMFKYAVQREVIRVNPFENIKIPEGIENHGNPNSAYNDDQIAKFYETYKDDLLGTVLMLGYHCGLRLSESIALTWNDVDFENKTIRIDKQLILRDGSLYFTMPKYNSVRTISIDNTMVEYLSNLKKLKENNSVMKKYSTSLDRRISEGDSFAFVVSKIDSTVVSNKYVHQRLDIFKKSGYPSFRTHNLRHTHCTKLISNGLSPKYVQERLGHKNIQTTMNIYHHLTDETKNTEDSRLNDLF